MSASGHRPSPTPRWRVSGLLENLAARVEALEPERATLQAGLDQERAQRYSAERVRDIAEERANAARARADDLAHREREWRSRL